MNLASDDALHIVILGGGTAGWLTASWFAHHWDDGSVRISVVESPEVGIIGVGEGSTPQLKSFFDTIGIAESEWMPQCDATYKLGIRFGGWSDRAGHSSYFHPFPGPLDPHSEPAFFRNAALRRGRVDVPAHPDSFYLSPRLAASGQGPHAPPHFPFALSYGYHFDAHKVGAMLRRHAMARGVQHLERHVAGTELAENGAIAALRCADGEKISGDFFVDCSGFRSLLIGQALGVPFLPFSANLFNDSAVVMPTAHDPAMPVRLETGSHALSAGWRWSIPLTTRIGNGYVYSSRFIDDAAAEAELRAALSPAADGVEARHLRMRVGRTEDSWAQNCLAMGLAQGFIEPLEATALHIVIATAQEFTAAFDAGGRTPRHRDTFNARIAARYDGIRDYIVAHYRMNQRAASGAYWADAAAMDDLSDNLRAMITAWFTGGDLGATIADLGIGGYYGAISWHALFAGYGIFPEPARSAQPGDGAADMVAVEDFLSRCALNYR